MKLPFGLTRNSLLALISAVISIILAIQSDRVTLGGAIIGVALGFAIFRLIQIYARRSVEQLSRQGSNKHVR